ncbi:glycosyltransferase [Herbaspirillum huttiense]|uniref:glycosyltransferase family protein n=1 Tax=Herbaspirillum huttiense TaxID=863372 RepID=UPI0039B0891C
MRIFQNSGVYPAYRKRLASLRKNDSTFKELMSTFMADRYAVAHYLLPVLNEAPDAYFTNGDDEDAQRVWAVENGMSRKATPQQILRAQIEHHRTEVFYNLDPMRYGSDFIRTLPGCVKRSFAWRAAPSRGADFSAYDLMLCNFPSILESYREQGLKAAYFCPAHDPVMDKFAANEDRPVDVLFVGGYTRHHSRRAVLLEEVAKLSGEFNVKFHLDRSKMTRLAESALGLALPLGKYKRPQAIREVSQAPVFGLDLYGALGNAKIVLNGAIDMAGADRGNMRCFEAMGCGALMVSDTGIYPAGMNDEESMFTYDNAAEAVSRIRRLIADGSTRTRVAKRGHEIMQSIYSKAQQWQAFENLAG